MKSLAHLCADFTGGFMQCHYVDKEATTADGFQAPLDLLKVI